MNSIVSFCLFVALACSRTATHDCITAELDSSVPPSPVLQRRAGPKGHGLYTDEDLEAGQFVIQYVGEVLEEEEYLRRKHYYIQTGQRHYYFMNIGNGEVIDACRKVREGSSR